MAVGCSLDSLMGTVYFVPQDGYITQRKQRVRVGSRKCDQDVLANWNDPGYKVNLSLQILQLRFSFSINSKGMEVVLALVTQFSDFVFLQNGLGFVGLDSIELKIPTKTQNISIISRSSAASPPRFELPSTSREAGTRPRPSKTRQAGPSTSDKTPSNYLWSRSHNENNLLITRYSTPITTRRTVTPGPREDQDRSGTPDNRT
ncbi:hypothetical protein R1sor_007164 [Riccia sorocarpa]|uniref:Uncharacterized protein n=1 Tax=Riccia sorocarpa TaxID=122646 RepID=A0ABD3HPM3_9MARC